MLSSSNFIQKNWYMDKKNNQCKSMGMMFLKKLRESKGLSQYMAAKKLGMLTTTYVYFENKAEGVKLETLNNIRKFYGLSWSELGNLIEDETKRKKKEKTIAGK